MSDTPEVTTDVEQSRPCIMCDATGFYAEGGKQWHCGQCGGTGTRWQRVSTEPFDIDALRASIREGGITLVNASDCDECDTLRAALSASQERAERAEAANTLLREGLELHRRAIAYMGPPRFASHDEYLTRYRAACAWIGEHPEFATTDADVPAARPSQGSTP